MRPPNECEQSSQYSVTKSEMQWTNQPIHVMIYNCNCQINVISQANR